MSEKIVAVCPRCQKRYNVPPEYRGRKLKCKACEHPFQIDDFPIEKQETTGVVMPEAVSSPAPQVSTPPAPADFQSALPPAASRHQERIEHRANPAMIPAMAGSIMGSLVVVIGCYLLGVFITYQTLTNNPEIARADGKQLSLDNALDENGVASKNPTTTTGKKNNTTDRLSQRPEFSASMREASRIDRMTPAPYEDPADNLILRARPKFSGEHNIGFARFVALTDRFVFLATDWVVLVYDLNSKEEIGGYYDWDSLGKITCMALSPDGNWLCVGGSSGSVGIFQVTEEGELVSSKTLASNDEVSEILVSPNNRMVAFITGRNLGKRQLHFGDLARGRILSQSTIRELQQLVSIQTNVKLNTIQLTDAEGRWMSWNWSDQSEENRGGLFGEIDPSNAPYFSDCDYSSDASHVVVNENSKLELWQLAPRTLIAKLETDSDPWESRFINDQVLVSTSDSLLLFDRSGNTIKKLAVPGSSTDDLAVSPSGERAAVLSGDLFVIDLAGE